MNIKIEGKIHSIILLGHTVKFFSRLLPAVFWERKSNWSIFFSLTAQWAGRRNPKFQKLDSSQAARYYVQHMHIVSLVRPTKNNLNSICFSNVSRCSNSYGGRSTHSETLTYKKKKKEKIFKTWRRETDCSDLIEISATQSWHNLKNRWVIDMNYSKTDLFDPAFMVTTDWITIPVMSQTCFLIIKRTSKYCKKL